MVIGHAHRSQIITDHPSSIADHRWPTHIIDHWGGVASPLADQSSVIDNRPYSTNDHPSYSSIVSHVLSLIIARSTFDRRSSNDDHQTSSIFDHRSLIICRHRRHRSSMTNHQHRLTSHRSYIIGHVSPSTTYHLIVIIDRRQKGLAVRCAR